LTFFGGVATALIGVFLFTLRSAAPGVNVGTNVFVSLIQDTLAYLPHIMLLFGVLADAVTYEGVYSIPSAVALISIPANWLMSYFWDLIGTIYAGLSDLGEKGPFPAVAPNVAARQAAQRAAMAGGGRPGQFSGNYDGCEVQGFGWARSKYAPQTLVVTATIFFYYVFDLVFNRGVNNAGAMIGLFVILYLAQVFVIADCPPGQAAGAWEPGKIVKAAIAAIEGMVFGGASYAIVQTFAPERLPSSAISIIPRMSASQLTPGPDGTMVDSNGNRYNCLPNGQCVPDLSSNESRAKFAGLVGETLGTGAPAVPGDCPASSS
jgi:hypothetical protein